MFIAKSRPKVETVQEHTENLLKNYELLRNLYGERIDIDFEILRLACIYHDLGKINDLFQKKIRGCRLEGNRKEIPHGLLSIFFLNLEELEEVYSSEEIEVLVTAIAKHHIREFDLDDGAEELRSEVDFLAAAAKDFNYDRLEKICVDKDRYILGYLLKDGMANMVGNHEQMKNYILIKGLLNRIDYAASAHINVEEKNDFLEESLFEIREKWRKLDTGADFNELQKFMIENRDSNVIAVAETGYGKTEAGLLWIGNNKGFFVLPLRSAINAIYDRIAFEMNIEGIEKKVALLHSSSLDEYFSLKENIGKITISNAEILDYNERGRQLSLPLTICTLDQIFKFVYKYQGFEAELATLAYSKIVIDEIQMYSSDLVAYLIEGLSIIDKLGGKFSIITATLPPFIIDLLRRKKINFVQSKEYIKNDRVRHCLELRQDEIDAEYIKMNFCKNKVLVITNTVKKAQELYEELSVDLEEYLNVFHSGYIVRDRKKKEREILEFGKTERDCIGIWICTQVAEASLDIDFDALITELSDLNGLFQRMGRCYRKREFNGSGPNVIVFDGGEDKTSGVGYVNDLDIFKMSKKKLREWLGNNKNKRITEKEKLEMINEIYTLDNLRTTKYFKDIIRSMNYLQSIYIEELSKAEVKKIFRNINSVNVIPQSVYDKNLAQIKNSIDILKKPYKDFKNKDFNNIRIEKIKAKLTINELEASIPYYLISETNTRELFINEYEKILIYECQYDSNFGIRHFKDKKDEEVDVSFNII